MATSSAKGGVVMLISGHPVRNLQPGWSVRESFSAVGRDQALVRMATSQHPSLLNRGEGGGEIT